MINFKCESCGKSFSVNDNLAGRDTKCPQCKQKIIIPSPHSPYESNQSSIPVPPVADKPDSQGTAAVWQATAQIGQAARSFGQAVAETSTFTWLTDWEFQDIRVHKSYRQSYRSSFRTAIIACVLVSLIVLVIGFVASSSMKSDTLSLVVVWMFILFIIAILWCAMLQYLCSLRLRYELLIIKLDCMIETTKAARLYVENKESEKQ